ncbi:DUF488 domain-containing protein [Rhodothermus profundi]|uniref:DUF488 domain-containing protein n=1 Tax=Rhodothermus profundi TaxID=633813 RepID=A0A1M6UDE6_9BACT|nr:Protein of unknown function, DUF488 [Rhodothermus profundi]
MTKKIYSIGYEKKDLNEFINILKSRDINVLLDVREIPWSRKKGFSKNQLNEVLKAHGITYIHAQFAGNPSYIRKTASSRKECLDRYRDFIKDNYSIIYKLIDEITTIVHQNKNAIVCIMCYESNHKECHRDILLSELLKTKKVDDLQIIHL